MLRFAQSDCKKRLIVLLVDKVYPRRKSESPILFLRSRPLDVPIELCIANELETDHWKAGKMGLGYIARTKAYWQCRHQKNLEKGINLMSKVAFLFPGQGAQFVGMGARLAESYPSVRDLYDRAAAVLGYDLAELCFNGPSEKLDSTVCSQPALFVTSLAALEALKAESPEVVLSCEMAAGLSLGEYTAMVFAGVMEFEDGLTLVQRRGAAMQKASDATPSGMVSILGLEPAQVEELCDKSREDGVLQVANYLCPGNIVISGTNDACERAAEMAQPFGAMKAVPLAVAGAFHTEVMRPADQSLAEALADVAMQKPKIPVISNVDAQPHDDPEEIRAILVKQVLQPVRWEDSMRLLLDQGVDQFYEVGPGRVLRGLLRRINRKIACQNVEV
jgi:[acyl-carrier-protein] S-malonyltransferase